MQPKVTKDNVMLLEKCKIQKWLNEWFIWLSQKIFLVIRLKGLKNIRWTFYLISCMATMDEQLFARMFSKEWLFHQKFVFIVPQIIPNHCEIKGFAISYHGIFFKCAPICFLETLSVNCFSFSMTFPIWCTRTLKQERRILSHLGEHILLKSVKCLRNLTSDFVDFFLERDCVRVRDVFKCKIFDRWWLFSLGKLNWNWNWVLN